MKKVQSDYTTTSNYYPSLVSASEEKKDTGRKVVNRGEKANHGWSANTLRSTKCHQALAADDTFAVNSDDRSGRTGKDVQCPGRV